MDDIRIKFTYLKPYYRQSELLELFSMSESTLRRMMAQHNAEGKSTASMGCFEIKGFSEKLWEPNAFQSFLENKISVQPKYDYESKDHKEVVNGLKVISTNNKRKELIR